MENKNEETENEKGCAKSIGGLVFMVVFIGGVGGLILLWNEIYSSVKKEDAKYKNELGKRVVIDGDTSTIIDYSKLNETLHLSNGKDVSIDIVKNYIIK